MPKLKTKRTVMDTLATEVKPGVWEYETTSYVWRWEVGSRGLNLSVCVKPLSDSNTWHTQLRAEKLDLAVMYAWGFEGGVVHGKQLAEVDRRASDEAVSEEDEQTIRESGE